MKERTKPAAQHVKVVQCIAPGPITPDGSTVPVGFVAAVTVQAEQKGPREKTILLQPGQTWQQVSDEIGRTGLAWILVLEGMLALDRDPRIAAAPVPAEFVRAMIEVARHATLAGSAKEALLSVDGFGPLGEKGAKFNPGRPEGAVGKLRLWVREYMKSNPTATAAQVWEAIKANPPPDITVCENRLGKYIETEGAPGTEYPAFANIVSKERPK
jgi:hypothetical protein